MSDYDVIGGNSALEVILSAFIDRVFSDPIIGFFFAGKDRDRILRHEIEFAARHLGGPSAYTGRAIGELHRPLRINRGQFRRRMAILRTVLGQHGLPADVIDRWIASESALIGMITDGSDCVPDT